MPVWREARNTLNQSRLGIPAPLFLLREELALITAVTPAVRVTASH